MKFLSVLVLSCLLVTVFSLDEEVLRPIRGDTDDVLYFWHVTDPHVDLNYTEGSNPHCKYPLCCHDFSGLNETSPRAGKFGYRKPGDVSPCDVPVSVFQSALDFIKSYPVKPVFINYGGDNLSHEDWVYSRELNLKYMRLVHDMMKVTLGKEAPVLSCIGNHDAYPIDQFDTPPGSKWYLDAFAEEMAYWLPEEAINQLKYAGYHSYLVRKGLRAIVLNTQYYDKFNFWLWKNASAVDFAGQIAFLERELNNAQNAGEKAIILGHIPLEGPIFFKKQIDMYERVYRTYSKIIIAHLYGHHHCEYFQAYTDPDNHDVATGIAYVGPVITTNSKSNPGVRLFKMNATTYEIIDAVTFFANVTEANEKGVLSWKHLYSAKESYGLPDLSPTSWLQLAKKMQTDDGLYAKFDAYYHAMGEAHCGTKATCRKSTLCTVMWMTPEQQDACRQAKQ